MTIDDKLPFIEKVVVVPNPPPAAERAPSGMGKDKRGEAKREGSSKEIIESTPLYPRTSMTSEIWPALLTKAILKVVALE